MLRFLSTCRRKYGRVFHFWPGNSSLIVVAEPVAARAILTDGRKFVKGPDYTEKFSVCFGEGLVTSRDPKHKRDRACLGRYFTRDAVLRHLRMMQALTETAMDEQLEQHCGARGDGVDIQHFFHTLTLQMFGRFAISHDYKADPYAEELNDIVSWGSNVIGEHIMLGIPVWSWLPRIRSMHRRLKKFFAHNDSLVDARIARRAAAKAAGDEHGGKGGVDGEGDVLDAMLDDSRISRRRSASSSSRCSRRATDTTAFFGCYMVHCLGDAPGGPGQGQGGDPRRARGRAAPSGRRARRQPADGRRAHADEVRAHDHAGDAAHVHGHSARHAHGGRRLRRADWRRAAARAGAASADKAAKAAAPASTIRVRKGQQVLVPLAVLNRDEAVWEQPGQFRPERFDGMCDTTSGYSSAKHGYLPFGYGARGCIGNTLAMTEGAAMVVALLRRYTFAPVPGFKPQIIGGISLVPKSGVRVRLERDDDAAVASAAPPASGRPRRRRRRRPTGFGGGVGGGVRDACAARCWSVRGGAAGAEGGLCVAAPSWRTTALRPRLAGCAIV